MELTPVQSAPSGIGIGIGEGIANHGIHRADGL